MNATLAEIEQAWRLRIARGLNAKYDDGYTGEELAQAAVYLALPAMDRIALRMQNISLWPWDGGEIPGLSDLSRQDQLIAAAVLIVAEIRRLDRAGPQEDR
jgi:hypothetical protein